MAPRATLCSGTHHLSTNASHLNTQIHSFDDPSNYLGPHNRYLGATVGRVANRIARGAFTLNDKSYSLAINNGPNALHGGLEGFDRRLWNVQPATEGSDPSIICTLCSDDGDQVGIGNALHKNATPLSSTLSGLPGRSARARHLHTATRHAGNRVPCSPGANRHARHAHQPHQPQLCVMMPHSVMVPPYKACNNQLLGAQISTYRAGWTLMCCRTRCR